MPNKKIKECEKIVIAFSNRLYILRKHVPPISAKEVRSLAASTRDFVASLIKALRLRTGIPSVRVDARSRIKSFTEGPVSSSAAMVERRITYFVVVLIRCLPDAPIIYSIRSLFLRWKDGLQSVVRPSRVWRKSTCTQNRYQHQSVHRTHRTTYTRRFGSTHSRLCVCSLPVPIPAGAEESIIRRRLRGRSVVLRDILKVQKAESW